MSIEQLEKAFDESQNLITLEEIKIYLNIDTDDTYYDTFLTELITASYIYIVKMVGYAWLLDETALKLGKILQKKLITDMFENRGSEIPNSTKRDLMVTSILDSLSLVGE